MVAVPAIALYMTGLAFAQQRGGGGFGGLGGGGAAQPIILLNNASVKKELDVTDAEMEKLPDAVRKALAEVLSDKQMKRLRQIELQQRGVAAFTEKTVSTELKLTDDQSMALKTIVTDSAKEMRGGFGAGGGGGREKIEAARKEAMDKAQDVLSSDQKKMWVVMIGEPFKMETPRAIGGGGFGKKAKKAAE